MCRRMNPYAHDTLFRHLTAPEKCSLSNRDGTPQNSICTSCFRSQKGNMNMLWSLSNVDAFQVAMMCRISSISIWKRILQHSAWIIRMKKPHCSTLSSHEHQVYMMATQDYHAHVLNRQLALKIAVDHKKGTIWSSKRNSKWCAWFNSVWSSWIEVRATTTAVHRHHHGNQHIGRRHIVKSGHAYPTLDARGNSLVLQISVRHFFFSQRHSNHHHFAF